MQAIATLLWSYKPQYFLSVKLMRDLLLKVKKQARELTVLQLDLADKDDYIGACERWIKSADPTTTLPLSEGAICKRSSTAPDILIRHRSPSHNKQAVTTLKVKLEAEVDKNHTVCT